MSLAKSGILQRGASSWKPVAVVFAFAFAYRDLLISCFNAIRVNSLSAIFLTPEKDTLLVGLMVGLWIARAESLRGSAEPAEAVSSIGAFAALSFAYVLLVWARIVQSPDLLLASLAALLIGLASLRQGRAGARSMILPAIVLVLAIPIPAPLEGEWVWALQKATAVSTSAFLNLLGVATTLEGVQIRWPGYHFDIAEGASGMRLLQVLLPISLAIGHRSGLRRDRLALYALAGVWLGFALNVVHTAVLLLSSRGASNGTGLGGSSLQAAMLLVVSIGLLVLMARLFSRTAGVDAEASSVPSAESRAPATLLRSTIVVAGIALLLSILVQSPFARRSQAPFPLTFPTQTSGWNSSDLPRNYSFPYSSPRTTVLARNFTPEKATPGQPNGIVELFVACEARGIERIPSSKLPLPSADWHLANEFGSPDEPLDPIIRVTELARNNKSEFALVYSWRKRDAGVFIESLRALSGMDGIVWTDERPACVIRVETPLASQLRSDRHRAMTLLDRFVRELGPELGRL